jgi:hypothetical protein
MCLLNCYIYIYKARTGRQDETGITGQAEKDVHICTGRTGLAEQDFKDRTATKEMPG